MQWAAPHYGWLLLLLPPLYGLSFRADHRRRLTLHKLGLTLQPLHPARLLWLTVVYLLLTAALCRPQWGSRTEQQETAGIDIIIALDTSRSMLADDIAPSRLDAAKKAVNALLEQLHGDRVGLVAFSSTAFLICPLTADYAAFRQMLSETGVSTLPRGGSDLASIQKEVLSGFSGTAARSRLLVLISDGEDHGTAAAAAARALRDSGIAIAGVTVGSRAGGIIPLAGGEFLKDRDGNIVRSHADPTRLELFAPLTMQLEPGGGGLVPLYSQIRPQLLQQQNKSSHQLPHERFQFPLAAALLLLVVESLLTTRRRT